MCTVTFSPRKTGYLLAMNRDELLTRSAGIGPARRTLDGRVVLCPSEPGGGTWIAVNQSGACFALINWYSVAARVPSRAVSRGKIIETLGGAAGAARVESLLKAYPLRKTNPFRLIGLFPASQEISEWRWDLKTLVRRKHRWRSQQWISSGFDERAAQRIRGRVFRQAQRQRSVGGREWLRRLHRSHRPQAGPFSTCMHRDDAATRSYTEVAVTQNRARMHYLLGAPCQQPVGRAAEHRLRLCWVQ